MQIRTVDQLREAMPGVLPWAIRELLIGNVIVGNFPPDIAVRMAFAIAKRVENERI